MDMRHVVYKCFACLLLLSTIGCHVSPSDNKFCKTEEEIQETDENDPQDLIYSINLYYNTKSLSVLGGEY